MNLENNIKGVIDNKIQEGIIEKLINENLENCIKNSLDNLFGNYGDITNLVKEKIKSIMVNHIESYDFSKYVVKLDNVLTEIIDNTSLDNKKILENFKDLMNDDVEKFINVSEIFDKYKKYVSENIDTTDLEVVYEGEPYYENAVVEFEFIEDESRSWSIMKTAKLFFECERDKYMNYEIKLYKYDDDKDWRIEKDRNISIDSLRHLDSFKLFFIKLYQNSSQIKIDSVGENDEVEIEAQPELQYR